MPRWPLAVLLVACGGSSQEPAAPGPTPYVFDGPDDGPPEVDLAAIERDLAALWPQLRTFNATPAVEAYALLATEQTEVCPRVYEIDGNSYWADACTTGSGTQFSGFAFAYDYPDLPVGEVWQGRVRLLQGGGRIARADGASLDVAGAAQRMDLRHVEQPVTLHHSVVRGTFAAAGLGELDATWLGTELRPDLTMFVYEHLEVGGRFLNVDGGLSGLGGGLGAVVFDRFQHVETALGGACEREPSGTVSVRTAEGVWVDVVFDGFDPDNWGRPVACDGVASAYIRGEPIGEIAVDGRALLAFEGAPW